MIYLVDTKVLSELMRPEPDRRVTRWVDRHGGECGLPTVVIFELRYGVVRLPAGRRSDELIGALERIVSRFGPRIVAFDRASAEMAADLRAQSHREGRPMAAMDAQIAAIAGIYGLTLATRNAGDFARTGIDLVDPWDS